jgi:hypothetical protein
MKKVLMLSLLTPFALVCSCQKQDQTAEQQSPQPKTELDTREKALEVKKKAVTEPQNLVVKPRVTPAPRSAAESHPTVPEELRGLMADPNKGRAEREQRMQERLAERQRKMAEIQSRRVPVRHSQATVPVTEEAASPSPSPTPE